MDASSFDHQYPRYAPFHPSNPHLHHRSAHPAPSCVSYNRDMVVPPNPQLQEQYRHRRPQPARPPPQIPSFGRAPVPPPPPCYRPYESNFTFLNPIRDDQVYNNPVDMANLNSSHPRNVHSSRFRFPERENSQIRSWDHSSVPVDNNLSDINFDGEAFSRKSIHYPPPSRIFHESKNKSEKYCKDFDPNRGKGTKFLKDVNGSSKYMSSSYKPSLPSSNSTFEGDSMKWNRSGCISSIKDGLHKDCKHDSLRENCDMLHTEQTLPKWDNVNAEICGTYEPKSFSAKRFPRRNVNVKDGAAYTPRKRSQERSILERVKRPFPATSHVNYEGRMLKDSSHVPVECNGFRGKECDLVDLDVRFRSNVVVAKSVVDNPSCPIAVTDRSTNYTDRNTRKVTKDSSYSSVLDSSVLMTGSPPKSITHDNIEDSMNGLDSAQGAFVRFRVDNSLGSLDLERESGEISISSDQDEDEINGVSLDEDMSVPCSHAASSPFTKYSNDNIACFTTESTDNIEVHPCCSDEMLRAEDGNMDKISHVLPLEYVGNVSLLSSQEQQPSKGLQDADGSNCRTNCSNNDKKSANVDISYVGTLDTCLDSEKFSCINNGMANKNGTSSESSDNSFLEDDNRSFNISTPVEEKTPMISLNVASTEYYTHAAVHKNSCSVLQQKCDKCCINIVHDTENIVCSDCIILSHDSNSTGESVSLMSSGMRRLCDDGENVPMTPTRRKLNIQSENTSSSTSLVNSNREEKDMLVSAGILLSHLQSPTTFNDNRDDKGINRPHTLVEADIFLKPQPKVKGCMNSIHFSQDFCYPSVTEVHKEKDNVQTSDVVEILPSNMNEDISDHPDHPIITSAPTYSMGITITSGSKYEGSFSEADGPMRYPLDSYSLKFINTDMAEVKLDACGVGTKYNDVGKTHVAVQHNLGMEVDREGEHYVFDDASVVQTADLLHRSTSTEGSHDCISANDYSHYQAEGICAVPNSEEPVTLSSQKQSDDTLNMKDIHNNELYCNSKTSSDHIISIPTTPLQNFEIVTSHQNVPEHKEVPHDAKSAKRILNVHSGNLPVKKSKMAYRYSKGLKGHTTATIPVSKHRGPPKGTPKSHTWHRTSKPLALLAEKKHFLTALEGQSPNRNRKMQNASYIRKGNSLVRKPSSISVNSWSSRVLSSSTGKLNSSTMEEMENQKGSNSMDDPSNCMTAVERLPTSQMHELLAGQQLSSSTIRTDTSPILLQISSSNNCSSTPINTPEHVETNNEQTSDHEITRSPVAETHISFENKMETQTILDDQSIVANMDKISYVKRNSNQLVAALNTRSILVHKADKTQVLFSDGYYKRSTHQLVRTAMQNHIKQGDLSQYDGLNSDGQIVPKIFRSASFNRRLSSKAKKRKQCKFSLVWQLGGSQPLKRESRSLLLVNMLPQLFPWKRATYRRRFMHRSTSSIRPISVARILDSSPKTSTIYTRSARGLSLRKAKVMGINGSNLKWSKSMDKKSKSANQEATLELVEVERRKKRRKVASPAACKYIRLCSGNKLIRDSMKRARILASEKVRWSLHTARNRLVRKRKYCQFYTRFGKCNKDEGGCPYLHDPSKVAVCTKFLNGLCYKPNCNLTHQIIPERMQDCTYFLQGMCSNEECPYRHVNVSRSAPVCDDFLKGYCADGDECRKKHRYVCLDFEVSGSCSQGTNCKLLHPSKQSEAKKRKRSLWTEQEDDRGRYFSGRIEIPESATSANRNRSAGGDDIFFRDGKFVDFVALNFGDDDDEDRDGSLQTVESDGGAGL